MSTKMFFPCTLVLAVLSVCAIRAQDYRTTPGDFGPPAGVPLDPTRVPAPVPQEAVAPPGAAGPGLSRWMTYQRPECCGNVGCFGPIGAELYVLTGLEIPAEGRIFGHVLETGWVVQGGGRTLFFNQAMDRDWNVDLSVSNILNRGQHSDKTVTLDLLLSPTSMITPVPFSIREMNRTYVNIALGREWYFHRPPDAWIRTWRLGLSAGGRLGSEKLEIEQVPSSSNMNSNFSTHRTDVISGTFVTLSTDVEIPCGCCTFLAGMRAEWGYTWADILQHQNDSDVQDVNILFTAGVRY
jgi:hypothetical protein